MELRSILDKILPVETPDEVRARIMKYGREHPDMSEADLLDMFGATLKRSIRKQKERMQKKDMDTAAAKRKITKAEGKSKKPEMMKGGMANGKAHMYAAGGSVTDNAGLRALKKASPEAYNKIKGI